MKKQTTFVIILASIMLCFPIHTTSLQRSTITIDATPSAFVTVRSKGFFDSGKTPLQVTGDYGSYSAVLMLAGYVPKLLTIDVDRPSIDIKVKLDENPNWKRLLNLSAGVQAEFDNIHSTDNLLIVRVGDNTDQMYSLSGGLNPIATKIDLATTSPTPPSNLLTKYKVAVWQSLGASSQTSVYVSPSGRFALVPRWVSVEQGTANLWLVDLQSDTELSIPEIVVGGAEQLTRNRVIWADDDSGFITSLFSDSQPRLFHITASPLKVTMTELLSLIKTAQKDSISIEYLVPNHDLSRVLVAPLIPGPAIKLALIDVIKGEVKVLPKPDWQLLAACWTSNDDLLLMQPTYGILKANYRTLNIDSLISSEDLGGATIHDARFSADCKDLFVLKDANLTDGSVLRLRMP